MEVAKAEAAKRKALSVNPEGESSQEMESVYPMLVFPTLRKTGGKITDINHTFTRLATRAGIKEVRFHDLRHTFASHLVMSSVDLVTVQQLFGHGSISMTLRYSYLAPEHRAKAVRVLDRAFVTDTKTDTADKSGIRTAGNY